LTSGDPDLKTSHSSDTLQTQHWAVLKKPYRRNELQRVLQDTLSSALGNKLAPALN
jgi:hypothetical protein